MHWTTVSMVLGVVVSVGLGATLLYRGMPRHTKVPKRPRTPRNVQFRTPKMSKTPKTANMGTPMRHLHETRKMVNSFCAKMQ